MTRRASLVSLMANLLLGMCLAELLRKPAPSCTSCCWLNWLVPQAAIVAAATSQCNTSANRAPIVSHCPTTTAQIRTLVGPHHRSAADAEGRARVPARLSQAQPTFREPFQRFTLRETTKAPDCRENRLRIDGHECPSCVHLCNQCLVNSTNWGEALFSTVYDTASMRCRNGPLLPQDGRGRGVLHLSRPPR